METESLTGFSSSENIDHEPWWFFLTALLEEQQW
jgi:hypothetical protein